MRFGIVINIDKGHVFGLLHPFLNELQSKKVDFVLNTEAQAAFAEYSWPRMNEYLDLDELVRDVDCVLSFGGDGTLLSTARAVGTLQKPILGVNIGKLGFLTEVEVAELYRAIEKIQRGDYQIEQRMVLEASWGEPVRKDFALNDFVIVRRDAARVIRIRAEVNGEFLNTYTADGLIVASPTGSTAYSLSSNGPILSPTLQAFIINPLCPHTLTVRPLVINSDQVITLHVEKGYTALFSADGQEEAEIDEGTVVTIREASHKVHLIRLGERTFFEVLRAKLRWGEDARKSE